ncbi:type I-E CRISPR-associated protein Cse1/CasA, partial [Proteus mirabilis]|nr:type I-E CRISPR-associated protein Cse1/CasA [Proteus mirabilis]
MDNKKPRGWYNLEMPIFHVKDEYNNKNINEIKIIQKLTIECLRSVKEQEKKAWFSRPKYMK